MTATVSQKLGSAALEIVTTQGNPLRARLHVWRTGDITDHDMHWATEGLKRDAVIDYGEAYLDGIGKIIP